MLLPYHLVVSFPVWLKPSILCIFYDIFAHNPFVYLPSVLFHYLLLRWRRKEEQITLLTVQIVSLDLRQSYFLVFGEKLGYSKSVMLDESCFLHVCQLPWNNGLVISFWKKKKKGEEIYLPFSLFHLLIIFFTIFSRGLNGLYINLTQLLFLMEPIIKMMLYLPCCVTHILTFIKERR